LAWPEIHKRPDYGRENIAGGGSAAAVSAAISAGIGGRGTDVSCASMAGEIAMIDSQTAVTRKFQLEHKKLLGILSPLPGFRRLPPSKIGLA